MMKSLTAAQQRFFDNVVLLAALQLIFDSLEKFGVPMYPLGEVANTTSGGTPDRGISDYYGGNIPWIKSGELRDGPIKESEEYITDAGLQNSSAKVFPKGTLVVALYGATVGKTGILAINAASNQAVCAITPNNRVSTFFLFWFLRYKRPDFLKGSFGAAQPNISQKVLRETLIPVPTTDLQKGICNFLEIVEERQRGKKDFLLPHLPSPLSNLRDIVARIEELAARIEEARGLRRKTVEETRVFDKYVYGLIWAEAEKNPSSLILLEQLADVIDPQPDHRTPPAFIGGMPYVSIANIGVDGKVDVLSARKVSSAAIEHQEASFTLKSGDIVLGKIGTIGAARPILVEERFALSANIVLVQPNRTKILDKLLLALLRSPQIEEQFTGGTRTTAQGAFGIKKMRKLLIPLPPLSEQHRIIAYLDDLQTKSDILKQLQSETSTELDALLPSILDKAFKGEL